MSKPKGHKAVGCQHFQKSRWSFIRESLTITRVNCLDDMYSFVILLIMTNTSKRKCTQYLKTIKWLKYLFLLTNNL